MKKTNKTKKNKTKNIEEKTNFASEQQPVDNMFNNIISRAMNFKLQLDENEELDKEELKKFREEKAKEQRARTILMRVMLLGITVLFTIISIMGWGAINGAIEEDASLPWLINATYINETLTISEQGELPYRLMGVIEQSNDHARIMRIGLLGIIASTALAVVGWLIILLLFFSNKTENRIEAYI